MRTWLKPGLLALALLVSSGASAEVAYVAKGVSVGVHLEPSQSSTILTLLPANTAVEILEQRNGLVRVRLGDGMEGWVDGRYLSKEAAPAQKAEGLEAELMQTATELANARELAAELRYQLNREKERVKIMESDLLKARKELETRSSNDNNSAAASADILRKLRETTDENREMKRRVAKLQADLEAAASKAQEPQVVIVKQNASSNNDASLLSRYTAITEWELWEIMLLFFGLLLAFAAGAYVVDWEVRRRHGGFRV